MSDMHDNPAPWVGWYSLDLYCNRLNEENHGVRVLFCQSFYGQTMKECADAAKKIGWKLHEKTRTATCPRCSRIKK